MNWSPMWCSGNGLIRVWSTCHPPWSGSSGETGGPLSCKRRWEQCEVWIGDVGGRWGLNFCPLVPTVEEFNCPTLVVCCSCFAYLLIIITMLSLDFVDWTYCVSLDLTWGCPGWGWGSLLHCLLSLHQPCPLLVPEEASTSCHHLRHRTAGGCRRSHWGCGAGWGGVPVIRCVSTPFRYLHPTPNRARQEGEA